MYQTFIGDRNSLVFPVMCNGHLLLDYSKNTPNAFESARTDDSTYGLWDLDTSFTIETILTPYDCSGNSSSSVTTSSKTLPYAAGTSTQSRRFLDTGNRLTYSMCIFYNTNAQLYLVNTASSLANKPAEYKLQFVVTTASGTSTLNSATVIKGVTSYNTNLEALYLITPYHIAASFNVATGSMDIIVNGISIASQVHTSKSTASMDFNIDNTDCYIGSTPPTGTFSTDGEASNRKQFMGELHELCITKGYNTDFSDIHTLIPTYENLLLYLRFEEIDA